MHVSGSYGECMTYIHLFKLLNEIWWRYCEVVHWDERESKGWPRFIQSEPCLFALALGIQQYRGLLVTKVLILLRSFNIFMKIGLALLMQKVLLILWSRYQQEQEKNLKLAMYCIKHQHRVSVASVAEIDLTAICKLAKQHDLQMSQMFPPPFNINLAKYSWGCGGVC